MNYNKSNEFIEINPNESHNNDMNDERIPSYPLRMPPELREHLESAAKNNGRSLNAEIVMRLEDSAKPKDSKTKQALTTEEIEELIESKVNLLLNVSKRDLKERKK